MKAIMNFSTILLTNVTTQTIIASLPMNDENEKKADAYARKHNITNPHVGMISVHYAK